MFEPVETTGDATTTSSPSTSQGPRTLSFGVRGGWTMGFRMSGVRVPFDPETPPEHQHLAEATLAEMMRRGGGGGDGEG